MRIQIQTLTRAASLATLIALCGVVMAEEAKPDGDAPAAELSQLEIDNAAVPIALYPDPLLSTVMAASTDMDQVAQAAHFYKAGQRRVQAVGWTPAVIDLTCFPDALEMMGENEEWARGLGSAVETHEKDVLEAVQHYRAKAIAAGILVSDEHQTVENDNGIIRILPKSREGVQVPSYDPDAVLSGGGSITYGDLAPWGDVPYYPDWDSWGVYYSDAYLNPYEYPEGYAVGWIYNPIYAGHRNPVRWRPRAYRRPASEGGVPTQRPDENRLRRAGLAPVGGARVQSTVNPRRSYSNPTRGTVAVNAPGTGLGAGYRQARRTADSARRGRSSRNARDMPRNQRGLARGTSSRTGYFNPRSGSSASRSSRRGSRSRSGGSRSGGSRR